ncbi:hypothetical protein JCM6294_747 [Bacteroides pyogenes DSM 20611 = JCM 6294]|uniref:Uncharacterized protein n=1 Tax=Bacteroides pyogenes DSM 20611 = JCM 6294 TaxID=1121100 RepID=W4PDU8_9BACE|nr:hypothetical protein JCM6294_747 [Bacteroides pyogenes DSM 20611 = JCM 6294]
MTLSFVYLRYERQKYKIRERKRKIDPLFLCRSRLFIFKWKENAAFTATKQRIASGDWL